MKPGKGAGRRRLVCAGIAALAVVAGLPGGAWGQAAMKQAETTKTYSVTLDAEKDYFSQGWVHVVAVSRAKGEVTLDKFDTTIRRTRDVAVPADARELIFRTEDNVVARLALKADSGHITVRPLSSGGSSGAIGWMFGKRGGSTPDKLVVEFEGK